MPTLSQPRLLSSPGVLLLIGVIASVSVACFSPPSPAPRPLAPDQFMLGQALRARLPGSTAARPDAVSAHLQITRVEPNTSQELLVISAVGNFDSQSAADFAAQVRLLQREMAPPVRILLQIFHEDEMGARTFIKRFDLN